MTQSFQSDFLRVLSERGFIHQLSDADGLDAALQDGPLTCYIGFDCTAPSLHVGSLVQIMMLHWFQQTGHTPIVLMGGGTTRVGDPSGKDESRQLLTAERIEENKTGIQKVFARFLDFERGESPATMVDNADWLLDLHYVDLLRDVGQHLSVNQMIQRDAVRLRLEREQHLSFLEFNYMVLQAYDFVELFDALVVDFRWVARTNGAIYCPGSILDGAWKVHRFSRLPRRYSPRHRAPRWGKQPKARCGSMRLCSRPTTIGNSGATLTMPMLAGS